MSVKVAQSCPTLWNPMDYTVPMGFSKQEDWSKLPFPSPGDLPNPGIEPESPALQADSLPSGKPSNVIGQPHRKRRFFLFKVPTFQITSKEELGRSFHPKANHAVILFIRVEAKCDQCLVAQTVKNLPAMQETWVQSLVGKIPCRRNWLPTPIFLLREFHGQRSLAGYSPWGRRVRHDWVT